MILIFTSFLPGIYKKDLHFFPSSIARDLPHAALQAYSNGGRVARWPRAHKWWPGPSPSWSPSPFCSRQWLPCPCREPTPSQGCCFAPESAASFLICAFSEKFLWGLEHVPEGRKECPIVCSRAISLKKSSGQEVRGSVSGRVLRPELPCPHSPLLLKADSDSAVPVCQALWGRSSQQPCKAGITPIWQMGKLRLGLFKWWSWDSTPGSLIPNPVVRPLCSMRYPGL